MSSLSEDKIPIRLHSDVLKAAVSKLMNHKHKNKRKVWDEDGNEKEIIESDEEEVMDLGGNTAELVSQKSREPKRIHLNLGKMEEDARSNDDEDDEGSEEEEEEEDAEDSEDGIKAENKTIEVDSSDSDSDVMEVPIEDVKPKSIAKQDDKQKDGRKKDVEGNAKPKETSKKDVKEEEPMSDDSDEVEVVKELTYEEKMRLAEKIVLDDSEEEETVVLPGHEKAAPQPNAQPQKSMKEEEKADTPNQKKQKKKNKNKKARTWYPQGKW